MRGKLPVVFFAAFQHRITPADAGKTYEVSLETGEYRDHPRGCGENRTGALSLTRRIGSPPRMRGKLVATAEPHGELGITPADAGKTFRVNYGRIIARDHPRRCGEN